MNFSTPTDADPDVIVIGGGASGLSAALVLTRARRRVLVIDAGSPRNAPAAHMHGYLSRDGLAPTELLEVGRAEVLGYGGEIWTGRVTAVRSDPDLLHVQLADGRTVSGRRLLLTTGLRDEIPRIPGLRERWARDVLHCPYCHGHEVRDRRLGVLGGSPGSIRYAQIVRQWSHDVVFFAPHGLLSSDEREQLLARAIGLVEGDVSGITIEDDRLSRIEMSDGRRIARDALFVPPRFVPNGELITQLGCEVDQNGFVAVDAEGRTSIAGVWAAGNVTDPRAQVITAAGQGSAAAISINAHLVDQEVREALDQYESVLPR